MPIISGPPRVTSEGGRTRWSVTVAGSTTDHLWFTVPGQHGHMLSDRADAALLALLLPAMRTGQELHIGGTVTDQLLWQITGTVQEIVALKLPGYQPIKIVAEEVAPPGAPGASVAMGFSNGIDSFAAFDQWFLADDVPERLKLTHLLFNNVGSHGDHEPAAGDLFRARLTDVQDFAEEVRLPVIDINSNLHSHFNLYPAYLNVAFANTHTMRNAAVAHLLGSGLHTWIYASSNPIAITNLNHSGTMGGADGLLLPQLSTGHLQLQLANQMERRVDKTRRVAELDLARRHLDVCVESARAERNCSMCDKCMRTQTALEMLGRLDDFAGVFDVDVYMARREAYAVQVLSSTTQLDRELRQLAKEVGWEWPLNARVKGATARAKGSVVAARRAAKKRAGR